MFAKKIIDVRIGLGGQSPESFRDFACEATIDKVGPPDKNSATVKLYGLSLAKMEQYTTLSFKPMESDKNLINIKAGQEGGVLYDIYFGEISQAWADFDSQPDPVFNIEAETGYYPGRIIEHETAVNGSAPLSALVKQQAQTAEYSFLNRGVTSSILNGFYHGSPIQKIVKMCREVGAELIIDDGEVIIMPEGGARNDDLPSLDKDSGLLGYPTFTQDGISARCIYRPDLFFGSLVEIKSIVPKASGVWKITKLSYNLATLKSGPWECSFEGQAYE